MNLARKQKDIQNLNAEGEGYVISLGLVDECSLSNWHMTPAMF
jgi:hypothetical protein